MEPPKAPMVEEKNGLWLLNSQIVLRPIHMHAVATWLQSDRIEGRE